MSGKSKKNRNRKRKRKDDLKGKQTNGVKTRDEEKLEETEGDDGESKNEDRNEVINEDSDEEQAPKRKKKKKQPAASDSTEKKGKKSIRQMKREKHLQRQAEAEATAKDQLKSQCISYLSQWKHDRDNWKFMKAKQVWLTKNKFSPSLVPNESWSVLLEYFESAKGNIRNTLVEDANKIIKQMDEWTEKQTKDKGNEDEAEEADKPNDTSYKRARDLIQSLQ